ncbi:ester cyclase [Variovorax paradoxus]|uniref:Ester cyclase n=1 Tax=Variovorax paradoxus TaxID=34073 RepID=A0A6I6H5E0_VARPD|nr:ester cyclase [Variovorax paradoxus]QGW82103.1 ester cyclase [Variovorax paradoxus]
MPEDDLVSAYHRYIACLNERDLGRLREFVAEDVEYNGRPVGLAGYRAMLEGNYRDIPDLKFSVQLVVADTASIAARLNFDCTPAGRFLGLDIDGRRVSFSENVFYEFVDGRIRYVWSVVDKAAIEAQL